MILSERLFLRLPYRLRSWLSQPAVIRCQAGLTGWKTPAVADLEQWQPNWMSHMLRVTLPSSEGAFIDVGVNRLSTYLDLRAIDPVRQYVGIEPNLPSAAIASEVIRLSQDKHAAIIACAASAECGVLDLWLRRGVQHDSCATTVKDLRPKLELERMIAPALDLDTILDRLGERRVALLKIDVEGGELEVLLGARQLLSLDRPQILCEVLFRDSSADQASYLARNADLMRLLETHQYRAFHVRKNPAATAVVGLTSVDSFPDRVWTKADQEECDYLFLPVEKLSRELDEFFGLPLVRSTQ